VGRRAVGRLPAAALYVIWYYRNLNPALAAAAPAAAVPLIQPIDSLGARPSGCPDELAGLLDTTLTQAWQQTQQQLGNIYTMALGRAASDGVQTPLTRPIRKSLAPQAA
jgi:hypothetical protein